jgi:fido (protein-threonine AMPylation protein)
MELLGCIIEKNEAEFKKQLLKTSPALTNDQLNLWYNQIANLYSAVNDIFNEVYDTVDLSMDFILAVHSKLCQNFLSTEETGIFRTRNVGQAGGSIPYLDFEKIHERLTELVRLTNAEYGAICREADRERALRKLVCLGSYFFSEFLLIHPFRDGNGRTARLLLSHLLRRHTVVPVCLYLCIAIAKCTLTPYNASKDMNPFRTMW